MEAVGIILAVLGSVGLLYGLYRKMLVEQVLRSPLVSSGDAATKGTEVAGEKGAIAVHGMPVSRKLLTSPITGTECLYYDYEVKQSWKEKVWDEQEQKEKTETKEVTLAAEKIGVNFSIDDGSGSVAIDSEDGGLFDLEQTFKASKGRGKLFESFKDYQEGDGDTYTLGNVVIDTSKAPEDSVYKVKERVLKPGQELFVCGKLLESGKIGGKGRTHLIVTPRTRDKFLSDTARWTRELLYGGGIAAPVGLLMYNVIAALIILAIAGAGYGVFRMYREQIAVLSEKVTQRVTGWTARLQKMIPAGS